MDPPSGMALPVVKTMSTSFSFISYSSPGVVEVAETAVIVPV